MINPSAMDAERQRMHGGRITEFAQSSGKSIDSFIDFSASINPYGLDSGLISVLKESIPLIEHYPNMDYSIIKKALAKKHSLNTSNVYLGNGANSIIYRFLQSFTTSQQSL